MKGTGDVGGARGLADDVRYYGQWMRDHAKDRIGTFYPKVRLPEEFGGEEADRNRVALGKDGAFVPIPRAVPKRR